MSDTIEIIIKVKDLASKALKDLNTAILHVNKTIDGVNGKDVDNLAFSVDEAGESAETLGDKLKKVSDYKPSGVIRGFGDLKDAVISVNQAAESAFSTLEKVSNIGKDIIKNQAGKTLFGAGATKLAGNFSKAIGEVGTLVDTTQLSTEELNNTVLDLSASYGVDKFDIAGALYQGISKGAEAGEEANTLLEVAIRGAIAGATDTTTVINGLTTVINSFGKEMSDAEEISDIMFTTMKIGGTTIGELSTFMFQAAPFSNALGVSFEELNAAIVSMTLQGTPTSQAMTGIRAALVGLIRPTGGAADAFAATEHKTGAAAIKAIGFAGALDLISKAAKGDVGQLQAMLGSAEAVQVVIQNSGRTAHLYANALKEIGESSGSTAGALKTMEGTLDDTLQKLQKSSNAVLTLFGAALGDTLRPLIKLFTGFFRIIADGIIEFPILTRVIVGFLAILVSLKVLLGLIIIAGSSFITILLKFFLFRTIGTLIGLFTGNLSSLRIALDAATVGLVRLLGAARVAAIKTALLSLGAAFLTLSANILTFLGLPSLAGYFTSGVGAAKKLGAVTFSLVGIYNKVINIIPLTIAAFLSLKTSVLALGASFVASSILMKATIIGAIAGAVFAVYKLIGAISDYYDRQERLNGSIERQEALIKKLEAAGAREVEILGAEELLELSKEQIDNYQEQILLQLKLVSAEFVLARASGESKEVQDNIWATRTKILTILHSTYDRERDLVQIANEKADGAERELSAKAKALALTRDLATVSADKTVVERQNKELLNNVKFERKILVDGNRAKSKLLRDQLANDKITISDYWDAINKLGLSSIEADRDVAVQKLKNRQKVQEFGLQQLAIQEEQALTALTGGGADDDEIRILKETFAIKREILGNQHATELDDLSHRIKELNQKEQTLISENNAQKLIDIKEDTKKTAEEAKQAEIDRSALQQEAYDRELEKLLAQQVAKRKSNEQDVQAGTINQFELGGRNAEDDQDTIDALEALKQKQLEYNAALTNPNNAISVAAIDEAIEELSETLDANVEKIQAGLVDGLATAFESIADGSKSAKDAFDDFGKSFLRMILKMITQALALQSIKLAFGAFSGGGSVTKVKTGGYIEAAEGGYITGKGSTTSDSIDAKLSDKEYVLNAKSVDHYGLNFIEAINRMKLPVTGGLPSFKITRPRRANFATGGSVSGSSNNSNTKPEVKLRVINNVDPDLVESYMNSRAGEETFLNLISINADKVKGILG